MDEINKLAKSAIDCIYNDEYDKILCILKSIVQLSRQ
jgi:hypothetical protein